MEPLNQPLNQPLNDDELQNALRQWSAPDAPASLERRVLSQAQSYGWLAVWHWLLKGSIRVPVPALVVAIGLLLATIVGLAKEAGKAPVSCASSDQRVAVAATRARCPSLKCL
jgi:hypothetical protein